MPNSEQGDLDKESGSSLTTLDYTIGELFRSVGAPLAAFKSAYWWGHQDLYVVARSVSSPASSLQPVDFGPPPR